MNKIKNTSDLRKEKENLRQRKDELEKSIHYDWRDFKENLTVKNALDQIFSSEEKIKSNTGFFSKWFYQLITGKMKKATDEIQKKVMSWFEK